MKVIAGTFRKDRDVAPEKDDEAPEFEKVTGLPPVPRKIGAEGRKMWTHLGGMLVRCGVLQAPDVYALELLCYNWQCYCEKKKRGDDIPTAFTNTLTSLFNQFGVTPTSRHRIVRRMTEQPLLPQNPFSEHGKRPGNTA